MYARVMPTVWLLVLLLLVGCKSPGAAEPRSWRMGFSAFPPRNDLNAAVQSLETWTKRADGAIFHISIPWAGLLAGKTPQQLLEADQMGIVNYYRQKQLPITVTLDLTDGLNRSQEAPQLIAAGRSLSEPEIQTLYRRYAVAVAQMIRPVYMGLAAETNLIRVAASPQLYSAVVASASAAAQDVEKLGLGIKLYISLQVETAWGRLQGTNAYVGAEQDFSDFSFISAVGLSSYPYLGRFDTPEAIPLEYFSRPLAGRNLPALVVEGGWPSVSGSGFTSSPDLQARYFRRLAQLADRAKLVGLFQLNFTDLDVASWFPGGAPLNLEPFIRLGLVDGNLRPKPALEVWDELFRRPLGTQ